jgi:ribonuclease BN (tRNA processing enzyme)
VRLTLWGTRGSVAYAGPETIGYGGDTSAVELRLGDGSLLVLDAGSGIQRLNDRIGGLDRIDVLLTHLHMDHIQGLGFFAPMFDSDVEVHVWGPASSRHTLEQRLSRYLSPPLFPVRMRDLSSVTVHDLEPGSFTIGPATVRADFVNHPGLTFGYRIGCDASSLAYIPDHEPALGSRDFPEGPEWTSGADLAAGVDILVHDAQYTDDEYALRKGWGHSTFRHAAAFARQSGVGTLVTFHHDPAHSDAMLESVMADIRRWQMPFVVIPGKTGTTLDL